MRGEQTYYDTMYSDLNNPDLTFLERWALRVLYLMDLSENLWRTANFVARRIPNGLIALILVPLAYIIANTLGGAAFYFDLDATRDTASPLIQRMHTAALAAGATGFLLTCIRWMPTTVTLFPTAMELLGSKFAKFGTPGWQMAVWVTAFFDLITDAPRVSAEMLGMWVWAAQGNEGFWGILFSFDLSVYAGVVLYYITFVLALIAASYVVEVLFICAVLVVLMLLLKSVGYWLFGLVLGLLAGRGWSTGVMTIIYRIFGTGDAPPPDVGGPRAGRSSRRERREQGQGRDRGRGRGQRPTRPGFEEDFDGDGFVDGEAVAM